jgi:putative hydrolase of the HAD superfamily
VAGAVLIDLYNTLVPGGDDGRAAMARLMGEDLGLDPGDFASVVVEAWPERMTGAYGDLASETLALAKRLGGDPSPEALATAVERRFAFARAHLVPGRVSVAAMESLRAAGWTVAIVSNCSFDSAAALRTTALASAVDALVLSCEVRLGKPDPAIYRLACAALGDVDPAACVFVGDGADHELRGAVGLGMRTIQTSEYRISDRSWTGERIASIRELQPLLRGTAA